MSSNLWLPPGVQGTQKPVSPSPADLEMEVLVDVYDHEILKLETALAAVAERYEFTEATEDNLLSFVNEVKQRFHEVGFIVDIGFQYIAGDTIRIPTLSLVARVDEDGDFDRERQTWEVQHNLLEIDDNPGAMRADGTIKSLDKTISLSGASKE